VRIEHARESDREMRLRVEHFAEAAEDERAIEALAPDGSHPAFRLRVRIGRLHRRPDDLDPFQPKIASTQLENLLSRSWIRNRNDR